MQQLSDLITAKLRPCRDRGKRHLRTEPIAQTICSMPVIAPNLVRNGVPKIDCIVTVVDALRLKSEFQAKRQPDLGGNRRGGYRESVIQQIEFCNIIVLNKVSEVTKEEAGHIRHVIRALQPKAEIIEADYCDFPLEKILNTRLFDFDKTVTSATWIQEIEKPLDEIEDHDEPHQEHEHEHHHAQEHHHEHEGHHHHHDEDEDHSHCDHEHGVCHCHHHHHHDGEGEAEEYGIGTFVYYRRLPFDLNRFDWFVGKHWLGERDQGEGRMLFFGQYRHVVSIRAGWSP